VGRELNTVSLNRQQFLRLVEDSSPFRSLASVVGETRADETVGLMFERQMRDTNPDGRYVLIPDQDLEKYGERMIAYVRAECEQIASKRAYAMELLESARTGDLRRRLEAASESDRSLIPKIRDLPKDVRELDLLKGGTWIGRTMHGQGGAEIVRETLADYLRTASSSEVLGRTPKMLDRLYARIFPNAPQSRSPNPEVTYPSSIGGRYLLEMIFDWTAEAIWPVPGDERWLDVARFYLGAIGTVQGYPDGNKRAARLAYTITLLRGRRRFVAPAPELERDLIQMRGPERQAAPG